MNQNSEGGLPPSQTVKTNMEELIEKIRSAQNREELSAALDEVETALETGRIAWPEYMDLYAIACEAWRY